MDPRALWLSATFAAAKLAIALWVGQLALSALDRRRVTLAWQAVLAVGTIAASWWAVRTGSVPTWWQPAWMASSLLAAVALLDCVRRWLSGPSLSQSHSDLSSQSPSEQVGSASAAGSAVNQAMSAGPSESCRQCSQRVHDALAVFGLGLAAVTGSIAVLAELPAGTLPRVAAIMHMLSGAGLLGIVLAAAFELTVGATGLALLSLNWRRLGRWAAAGLLGQLATSTIIVAFRRDGATPVESLTPIFFALGMVIVGYVVWTIPRQMVGLAAKKRMEGQASLAVASWLAAICLAVACALPAAWPWTEVQSPSGGFAQPVLPSR